jgi:predicted nucleic acid-binding protein
LKFLIDTSVYLRIFHDRTFALAAEPTLRRIAPRLYLSSVVRAELTQGARGDAGRRLVSRLARSLERTGLVIAPAHDDWVLASTIQSKIWDRSAALRTKRLLHDLLIACTARRVGACVITEDEDDFRIVGEWLPTDRLHPEDLLLV